MFGFQNGLDPDLHHGLVVGLNAVIVAVFGGEPRVMTIREKSFFGGGKEDYLPFGPFQPLQHRTLDMGLRSWVEAQTELKLGYVEQLYTFGDRGRDPREAQGGERVISVGYLALVSPISETQEQQTNWKGWYGYFPWEDWRDGKPVILEQEITPKLAIWAHEARKGPERNARMARIERVFGETLAVWNEELVLERYELLYEAKLVGEACRDDNDLAKENGFGRPMALDHRRILATAMGRLRSKIKYRPVLFELMPPVFTLLQLQRLVEGLAGKLLHKQNFRRLLEHNGLVEPTGQMETQTGGRPAQQFRFRRNILAERENVGMKLPGTRS
jgi:hypothetical protein